jgi:hypothetical protein
MFYADDVSVMEGSEHSLNKKPEALLVGTKEIGLDVDADKTKYMIMSADQNSE